MTAAEHASDAGATAIAGTEDDFQADVNSPFAALELADERMAVAEDGASLSAQVRKGALWGALNTLVLRFANIAIMAVVARHLSVTDFGVFALAMTAFTIISCIAELGVTSCLLRVDIDVTKVAPTVAAISMVSSVVLAVAMFVFATPLATALGSVHAAGPMRIMTLSILMVGLFAVPSAEVSRNFRQDQQFFASIIGFIPANGLLVVMALHGGGAASFAWSRVLGQFLTGMVIVYLAPRYYWPRFSRSETRFVVFFGLPLAGANVLNFILLNADYALVGRLLGTVELGIYTLAFNISSWSSSVLSSTVNGVGMTAFSHVKDDPIRFERSLARSTAAIAIISFPICGLTFALAPDLVQTLYGNHWSAVAPVLVILCVYGALSTYCMLLANVLGGIAHTRALFAVQVAWLVTLVPAMAIGVHFGGIIGAAWAHVVIVSLIAVPVYLIMLKRSSRVRLVTMVPAVLPALGASAIGAVVAHFVAEAGSSPALRLLGGGFAGVFVYLVLVLPSALAVAGGASSLPRAAAKPVARYVAFAERVRKSVGFGDRRV